MTANLADLVADAATSAPDAVALVDAGTGQETTWRDLDETVGRVAAGLAALGLVAGNRVLLATGQRTELVVAYLAALRGRMVAVPVNPRSVAGEIVRVVADSRPRAVVADAATLDVLRSVVGGLRDARAAAPPDVRDRAVVPRTVTLDRPPEPEETAWTALTRAAPSRTPAAPPPLPPAPGDPEALAVLLYTSGTSGRPRAAMLSHRALLANLDQVARLDPPMLGPDDVVYGLLPMYHVYGLNAVLGQVLHRRARLVVPASFDAEGSLDDIAAHGVTAVPLTPTVVAHWMDVPDLRGRLDGVRTVVSGSAPLSADLAERFTRRTGLLVHQGYGLTEAAPVVTSTWGRPLKAGSVGAPLPGVSLRLADESGAPPEGADPGEILVAGANLFSGYWPDGEDGPVDGWLATGDLGFLDEDGDLFLVDRLKELIIVSGFNVYPSEVEEVIDDVPGVLESAVVGVPDPHTGEAVVAYVRSDAADDADHAEAVRARVQQACAARLARYKQPTRVELVDRLPRTPGGGVARGRLRATVRRERTGLIE